MARIAWRFEDPLDGSILYAQINPNDGASPTFQKTLTKMTTTAPGGAATTLVFEGSDAPIQFDFSGTLLTQDQYNFYYNAWAKRHPILLTDDLGRTFRVYFEAFNPKRVRSANYPWRHTYDATAVVIT
jgi:hypothetical protein